MNIIDWFKKVFTNKKVVKQEELLIITDAQDVKQEETVIETIQEKKSTENKKSTKSTKKENKQVYGNTVNNKYNKIVIFLTPGHTDKTPGKKSPDGKLKEWEYNRIIVHKIEEELDKLGIEHWNSHPEDSWVDAAHSTDSKDLLLRVQRINQQYKKVKLKGKTAIMLSIHVNAAGNGDWKNATGWSAWTTKGRNNSDKLADCLYDAAEEILTPMNKVIRKDMSDGDRDYEANFYVIKNASCISVLTENFFMDNKEDMKWLLTNKGKDTITKIHIEGIKKYIERYV